MENNNNGVIFKITVEKNNEYFRCASKGLTSIQKSRFLVYFLSLIIMAESVALTATTDIKMGIIILALGIFLFLLTAFTTERNISILKKRTPSWQTASPTDFFFRKNGFSESSAFTKSECSYKMIQSVKETKDAYFLFIGYAQALVIPKSCIAEERQDEFRSFICSVTGNECKSIKNRSVVSRVIISVIVSLLAIGSLVTVHFVITLANMKPMTVTAILDDMVCTAEVNGIFECTYEDDTTKQFTDGSYTIEISSFTEAEIKDMYKLKEAPDTNQMAEADTKKYGDTAEFGVLLNEMDYSVVDDEGYYCFSVYNKINKTYYIADIYIYDNLTDEEKDSVLAIAESINFAEYETQE